MGRHGKSEHTVADLLHYHGMYDRFSGLVLNQQLFSRRPNVEGRVDKNLVAKTVRSRFQDSMVANSKTSNRVSVLLSRIRSSLCGNEPISLLSISSTLLLVARA